MQQQRPWTAAAGGGLVNGNGAKSSPLYGPQTIYSPYAVPTGPFCAGTVTFNHMGRASSHPIYIQPTIGSPPPVQSAPTAAAGSPIKSPPLRMNNGSSRASSPLDVKNN